MRCVQVKQMQMQLVAHVSAFSSVIMHLIFQIHIIVDIV